MNYNLDNKQIENIDINNTIGSENDTNYGKKALLLSLVLVGVIIVCYIYSGGNFDENRGLVWLFCGIYCVVAELPVIIVSTIYGIKGLKEQNVIFSFLSFIINSLKILFVIIAMR